MNIDEQMQKIAPHLEKFPIGSDVMYLDVRWRVIKNQRDMMDIQEHDISRFVLAILKLERINGMGCYESITLDAPELIKLANPAMPQMYYCV